jgi:hypothetical protein
VPKGFFSWSQPKSPEVLQKQFESVPLIQALRQRGVNVPPLSAINRQAFGADLFSNKRLKQGVYSMIAVSFAATATHFFAAHDYAIGQPSWLNTAIFMATCMLICWFWLWQAKPELSLRKSERYQFFAAQIFVSVVMAVLLTWLVYGMTLANTKINRPAIHLDFVLDIDKYQLRPSDKALATHPGLESIKLDFGREYWQAQPKGAIVPIEIRRNFWLRLWQYDREPMLERMREFYSRR